MMYETLYQYFILHKKLSIPGIGTFLMERKPVVNDFVNKQMHPPSYAVSLQAATDSPATHFFKWMGGALHVSDRDAIIRFNDFAFDLKKQIGSGDIIAWDGVGTLSKGLAAEIKFVSSENKIFGAPVMAEKIIREKAEHMVRVGEDHKTSVEMTEMLNQSPGKKSYWWIPSLIIALLAFMFIGWYFSEHGLDVSSTANEQKLIPLETSAPYEILP